MRTTFHTTSLPLILRQVQLERIEKELLETLLGAAHAGLYWDTLRLWSTPGEPLNG
jgi:hypothetical protein